MDDRGALFVMIEALVPALFYIAFDRFFKKSFLDGSCTSFRFYSFFGGLGAFFQEPVKLFNANFLVFELWSRFLGDDDQLVFVVQIGFPFGEDKEFFLIIQFCALGDIKSKFGLGVYLIYVLSACTAASAEYKGCFRYDVSFNNFRSFHNCLQSYAFFV